MQKIAVKKIKKFHGISPGSEYDLMWIEKFYGYVPKAISLKYSHNNDRIELQQTALKNRKNDGYVRVMIGHSGYPSYQHIEMMELLKKFSGEKIKICIVFAYGNEEYMKSVEEYAKNNFPEEMVEFNKTFMDLEKYVQYLADMDIVFFSHNGSAALGNISQLIGLYKKFYVYKDSYTDLMLDYEGIDHGYIDEVGEMSFEDFTKPILNISACDKYQKRVSEKDLIAKNWGKILNELRNMEIPRKDII